MKKLEMKLGAKMLTKEQMRKIAGGTVCAAIVSCYSIDDGDAPCSFEAQNVNCGADNHSLCASNCGLDYFESNCTCE